MAKIKTKISKTNNLKKKKVVKVKPTSKKTKNDYGTMSVDDFFSKYDEEENLLEESNENESEIDEEQDANSETSDVDEAEKHKHDLEKLKDTDPEFYQFLQDNDKKLLNFDLSDEERDADDDSAPEQDSVHKPDDNLAVASDESDFEDEDDKPTDSRTITLKMLKAWQNDIQTDKSNKTIVALTQAFHAALLRVSNPEEADEIAHYKVDGSSVFNAVIQICVLELGPAVKRFLGLKPGARQPPHKCKKFTKIKRALKDYFTDLLRILSVVTSSNIQTVLLKHLHYLSSLLTSFQNITKSIIKRLIALWSTSDESVRVVAFFCILRITHNQQASILDTVLKSMYMQYVKNSKFISLSSLAGVNFMRRSLVELFSLDINVTYQHVFLYIRQLAIHLRNAITLKKKENLQAVYNWQFVNSLRLWGNLLSVTCNKPQLQQLIYPFVQVCLGTIKLIPTAQYYPLRFHIVQILIDLSRDADIFVPVLPFLLEVLTNFDFNKKHKKVSMKPMHFTCLLRLSKSQLQENGFKDMVIEMIYGQLLEYLSNNSNSVAFPDLSLLCSISLKQFIKKCRNLNYTRKMKQVLEKIEQNSQFIEKERDKLTLNITDLKQINGWESQIGSNGTPLKEFYENWKKLHNMKKNKQLTNNDELADYKLPKLKKPIVKEKKPAGPVELFPSDDDSDEDTSQTANKPKRGKRGGKNVNKTTKLDDGRPVDDGGVKDIVEDIEISDW